MTEATPSPLRLSVSAVRTNGVLWALGNSLTTGNFIFFLASDLGAKGLGLGILMALPNLVGAARCLVPPLIVARGARKITLGCGLIAYLLLAGGLTAVDLRAKGSSTMVVGLLIGLITLHQALEYLSQVGLWCWYGELIPERIRGRVFAGRQTAQSLTVVPLTLASAWFIDALQSTSWKDYRYLLVHGLGCVCLLTSLIPLLRLSGGGPRRVAQQSPNGIAQAFADRRYRAFLWFRGALSLANGWSQTAQLEWSKTVLGLGIIVPTIGRSLMHLGQAAVAQSLGSWWDRHGYRRTLLAAQTIVTIGLACYLAAEPGRGELSLGQWFGAERSIPFNAVWIILGWTCWSAYAVHNVALPNLALHFAPAPQRAGYIAAYEALGSVVHAASTIAGGVFYDYLPATKHFTTGQTCVTMIATAVVLRGLTIFPLLFLGETIANNQPVPYTEQ